MASGLDVLGTPRPAEPGPGSWVSSQTQAPPQPGTNHLPPASTDLTPRRPHSRGTTWFWCFCVWLLSSRLVRGGVCIKMSFLFRADDGSLLGLYLPSQRAQVRARLSGFCEWLQASFRVLSASHMGTGHLQQQVAPVIGDHGFQVASPRVGVPEDRDAQGRWRWALGTGAREEAEPSGGELARLLERWPRKWQVSWDLHTGGWSSAAARTPQDAGQVGR